MSFDFNVSYSSCWGYSLINTLKLKKNLGRLGRSPEVSDNAESNAQGTCLAVLLCSWCGYASLTVCMNARVHAPHIHRSQSFSFSGGSAGPTLWPTMIFGQSLGWALMRCIVLQLLTLDSCHSVGSMGSATGMIGGNISKAEQTVLIMPHGYNGLHLLQSAAQSCRTGMDCFYNGCIGCIGSAVPSGGCFESGCGHCGCHNGICIKK